MATVMSTVMKQISRNLCKFVTISHARLSSSALEEDVVSKRKNIWKLRRERFLSNILGLVQQGKIEEADNVFTSMTTKHKIKPNTVLYNALLKGYAAVGDTKSAFKLFNKLKKHGLEPSHHTYSTMFRTCSRAGPAGKTVLDKVMDEIERRDVILNTQSFNAQLSALIHCEEAIDRVFELYHDSEAPETSIETLGTLLLAASKDYSDGMRRCIDIWGEVVSRFTANLHCYNTLLHCVRTSGISPDLLQQPAASSKTSAGLIPVNQVSLHLSSSNAVPLNLTVYVSRNNIRWLEKESLDNLLSAMESDSVIPDIRTLTILSSLFPDFAEIVQLSKQFSIQLDDRVTESTRLRKLLEGGSNRATVKAGHNLRKQHRLLLLEKMRDCTDPSEWINVVKLYARLRDYTALITTLKRMKYNEVYISDELLSTLDCIADDQPKNLKLRHSYNGFKGYYRLWCESIGKR